MSKRKARGGREPRLELTTKNMVVIAMFGAVAVVLYFLVEIPIIPFAPHLKVNFADIPAFVAGMVVSPLAGIIVLGLRCVLHLLKTSTLGIGEAIDFIVGASMLLAFFFAYDRLRGRWSYVLSAIATVAAAIVAGIAANLIFYPIFIWVMFGQTIESLTVFAIYLGGTVTTNIIRAVVTCVVTAVFLPVIPRLRAIR